MTTTQHTDEDSFIILGSSPGTSLDMKYSGLENGDNVAVDKDQMEEAMKDLSVEANMAFKAHFRLGDSSPSPTSMMVASTIITDDKTTEDLQKKFGELLDENVILKETLKHNNESMKEQFLLIASCQEDMMRTHELHKEKFDETKGLVEKLRQENKKLKLDIARLSDTEPQSHTSSDTTDRDSGRSGPSSAMEFVTSPDDDVINKLTAQLDLVEKQRRQVIVDNEKLTWQKESLEHIVDATSRERDDLKEKLKDTELCLSIRDAEYTAEVKQLKYTIQELQKQVTSDNLLRVPFEEFKERERRIEILEPKVASLQSDLKKAQLRILELESIKLEFSKHRSGAAEALRIYRDQVQDLHTKLREASTIVFQPVRISVSAEPESSSEYSSFTSNVKLYDRTLKHLSEIFNIQTNAIVDGLIENLGILASLQDYKLNKKTEEEFKLALSETKMNTEKQHNTALGHIGQIKSTLTIFEGIFRDYNELLKKSVSKPKLERSTANVEALTAALVARGQELQSLEEQLRKEREEKEDRELLKAQMDLYKSDFEAEREAREKMASEKETILTDLRTTQRRNQELTKQLDEVRKLNPSVFQSSLGRVSHPRSPARPASAQAAPTGNMVFTCPKCMRFSCDEYKVMEDHFDFCLDDF